LVYRADRHRGQRGNVHRLLECPLNEGIPVRQFEFPQQHLATGRQRAIRPLLDERSFEAAHCIGL
jgi:hypothetical protein